MPDKIFVDKAFKPKNEDLSRVLGTTYKLWEDLKISLKDDYGSLTEEWKYYGQKLGWTLKLLHKKRNLFFFAPYDKFFVVAFTFGNKAVEAIEQSDLPAKLIEELKNARKYVEGRGLRIEVRKKNEIKIIRKLVFYKINN